MANGGGILIKAAAALAGGVAAAALDSRMPDGFNMPVIGHVKTGEAATVATLVLAGVLRSPTLGMAAVGGVAVEGLGRAAEYMPSIFGHGAPQQMAAQGVYGQLAPAQYQTHRQVPDSVVFANLDRLNV